VHRSLRRLFVGKKLPEANFENARVVKTHAGFFIYPAKFV
jgi:hypothetical protein